MANERVRVWNAELWAEPPRIKKMFSFTPSETINETIGIDQRKFNAYIRLRNMKTLQDVRVQLNNALVFYYL